MRMSGIASISMRVYGWRGRVNNARVGASSTSRPRYITPVRSAMCEITARLCEMNRYVRRSVRCSCFIRLSICACTDTSSAEVGSSHTRNSGLEDSARAIEMRWRWPPENSCGYFSPSSAVSPTCRSSSPTRALMPSRSVAIALLAPCTRSGSAMMSLTRQRGLRLAYGSWKIICMRRRASRCTTLFAVCVSIVVPSNVIDPREGRYSPTMSRATVDLPHPDSPTSPSVSPRAMVKLTSSTARRIWRPSRSNIRLSQGLETSKSRPSPLATTRGRSDAASPAS